ncbi:MAG: hypothetical protein K2H92_02530 [Bacteroidaceae bacterium]|nr:hypothetical protein [Bacteroidaceae bacterium]
MSGTSTNRSPRHRSVGVGDSDLEGVKPLHTLTCSAVYGRRPCEGMQEKC